MKTKKAQSVLEYTVILVCVVAALLAMQIYLKRAKEGGLRQAADSLGQQYAPKRTDSTSTVTYYSKTKETSKTMSERDAYIASGFTTHYDFNMNNVFDEDNVFATEMDSSLKESNQTQTGWENVSEFGESLFED